MPDFTLLGGGTRIEAGGQDTSDSELTDLGAGAADTKTSYAELIASSSFDAAWLHIELMGGKISGLLDIAVGAAASEQDVVPNLLWYGGDSRTGKSWLLPLFIPAGSRVAARKQTASGNATGVAVHLIGAPLLSGPTFRRMTAYGADTADSGGAQIDPGASGNTKGAYTQVVASTSNPVRALLMAFSGGDNNAHTTTAWLIDLAVGSATSEQIIIPNISVATSNQEAMQPTSVGPVPVNIPAGTRIAARAQCGITDATDRLIDIAVYGFD